MKNNTNYSKGLKKNRNYNCNKEFLNSTEDLTFTITKNKYNKLQLQKMSFLYNKRLFLFFQVVVEKKLWWSFLSVFGSNQLRYSSYKLTSSENKFSEYPEDDRVAKYFLAKLARRGCSVLFKFHQFKILFSSVSVFKFSVAKRIYFCFNFFISWILLLVLLCSCVWFYFKQGIVSWKLLRIKIYRG